MEILSIISLLIALIAVLISLATLQENRNMIEESTKPYVVVYARVANFEGPRYYIIVKNFGTTGAKIINFKVDFDLSKYSYDDERTPFEHLENSFLAPNQSVICNIDPLKYCRNPHPIVFDVTYGTKRNQYNDVYNINIQSEMDNIQTRASTKDKELKIISYTLQDLVEKHL